jgi:hypothetical protein
MIKLKSKFLAPLFLVATLNSAFAFDRSADELFVPDSDKNREFCKIEKRIAQDEMSFLKQLYEDKMQFYDTADQEYKTFLDDTIQSAQGRLEQSQERHFDSCQALA